MLLALPVYSSVLVWCFQIAINAKHAKWQHTVIIKHHSQLVMVASSLSQSGHYLLSVLTPVYLHV